MIKGFEDTVLDAFLSYDWPGNVRELQNIVERAYILCPNVTISSKYLPMKLQSRMGKGPDVIDEMNLVETERRLIINALNNSAWNQSKAAEVLGISRKQLRTKMKNLGLLPRLVSETTSGSE
jgi:two-component system response regulator AtoC